MKLMDEIAVVLKRFGDDDQSTLLDQFERLSFEVQLNQAILGRSLSEPGGVGRSRFHPLLNREALPAPALVKKQVRQGKRRRGGSTGFKKMLKKLLKPVFGTRNGAKKCAAFDHDIEREEIPDPKNPRSWKALSRSLRF